MSDENNNDQTYGDFDTGRERGWLLIKTDEIEGDEKNNFAKELHKRWRDRGEKVDEDYPHDFVVIRVDVVGKNDFGFDFDFIVPVDTKGKLGDFKTYFLNKEQEEKGRKLIKNINHQKIDKHYPAITYLAQGFVSEAEFKKASKKQVHPDHFGRIKRRSPGDNPWG